jgi:DNA-binding transcriptional MerR regulator
MIETTETTNQKLLKRDEVAAMLRVSKHAVRLYERQGKLSRVQINARVIRYKPVEVQRLIDAQATTATTQGTP